MIDEIDLSYLNMRARRAELAETMQELYDLLGKEPANRVWVSFLHYEKAVLQVMQENLDAIDVLIQRVDEAEKTNSG